MTRIYCTAPNLANAKLLGTHLWSILPYDISIRIIIIYDRRRDHSLTCYCEIRLLESTAIDTYLRNKYSRTLQCFGSRCLVGPWLCISPACLSTPLSSGADGENLQWKMSISHDYQVSRKSCPLKMPGSSRRYEVGSIFSLSYLTSYIFP